MPAAKVKSREEIQRLCVAYVARVLNQPEARVSPDAELDAFGLDSALSVGMLVELEAAMGMEIQPAVLLEQSTIAQLAAHLASRAGG